MKYWRQYIVCPLPMIHGTEASASVRSIEIWVESLDLERLMTIEFQSATTITLWAEEGKCTTSSKPQS